MRTMSRNLSTLTASLVLFTAAPLTARADTFIMHFQVAGFAVSNGNPPPVDPVTGTIVWEATGIHDPVQSFDSIDLTLDGHSYSIEEIGFLPWPYPPGDVVIGGTISGVQALVNLTDDFSIEWNQSSLIPDGFIYSSSRLSGIWTVGDPTSFTAFSITEVPEPSTISLFSFVLFGAGAWRLRQRTLRLR